MTVLALPNHGRTWNRKGYAGTSSYRHGTVIFGSRALVNSATRFQVIDHDKNSGQDLATLSTLLPKAFAQFDAYIEKPERLALLDRISDLTSEDEWEYDNKIPDMESICGALMARAVSKRPANGASFDSDGLMSIYWVGKRGKVSAKGQPTGKFSWAAALFDDRVLTSSDTEDSFAAFVELVAKID